MAHARYAGEGARSVHEAVTSIHAVRDRRDLAAPEESVSRPESPYPTRGLGRCAHHRQVARSRCPVCWNRTGRVRIQPHHGNRAHDPQRAVGEQGRVGQEDRGDDCGRREGEAGRRAARRDRPARQHRAGAVPHPRQPAGKAEAGSDNDDRWYGDLPAAGGHGGRRG